MCLGRAAGTEREHRSLRGWAGLWLRRPSEAVEHGLEQGEEEAEWVEQHEALS
jgi:hypothetical protein